LGPNADFGRAVVLRCFNWPLLENRVSTFWNRNRIGKLFPFDSLPGIQLFSQTWLSELFVIDPAG
jgi:hypothetical protein